MAALTTAMGNFTARTAGRCGTRELKAALVCHRPSWIDLVEILRCSAKNSRVRWVRVLGVVPPSDCPRVPRPTSEEHGFRIHGGARTMTTTQHRTTMIRGEAKSLGWIGRRGSVDPSAHRANGGRDDVEAIGVHWNAQRRVPAVCAKRSTHAHMNSAHGAMMWGRKIRTPGLGVLPSLVCFVAAGG
jgi:hypothetical protein